MSARAATTANVAPTSAGIAYNLLLSTLGILPIRTSRTVPPPMPVTAPRITA